MIRAVLAASAWTAYGAFVGHATGAGLAVALAAGVLVVGVWAGRQGIG